MPWFETVTDLTAQAAVVRRRRYGVLEVADRQLVQVRFRPWPTLFAVEEFMAWKEWRRRSAPGDRCWIYFNQPRRFPQFLAVKFLVGTPQVRLATLHEALRLLDQIAQIKGCDALLCDAANVRLSERLMARHGWLPHAPSRWHRNFIRRLYEPPPVPQLEPELAALLQSIQQ